MLLEATDGLWETLGKIETQLPEGGELTLTVPLGSPLFSNLLSLKLLKKEAELRGVELQLETEDERGGNLIASLEGRKEASPTPAFGFKEGEDIYTEIGQAAEESGHRLMTILKFLILGLALLGGGFALLWTVPKATVRLTVKSEALVQSFEITASPSAAVADRERRILPAVLIDAEERGEQRASATGKKEKGEKAKSEVTIYNWTDNEKTFARETALTLIRVEGEKLKFLLDEEVKVPALIASVSATPEERTTTYTPGKKTASVVAEKVGEEYNAAANSKFSISGLSTDDFLAQNRDSFTGGKKQEVQVVTPEDQQRLLQRLKDELGRKIKEDIVSRTVGDQKLIEDALTYEVLSQEFDKEVDEEAKELTLSLRLKGRALVYSQSQLGSLLSDLLSENVPKDFSLSDKDFVTEVSAAKADKILAKVRAFVVPKLDKERVKKEVAGRSLGAAEKYFESIPNIGAVEITIFPPLPGPLQRMPRITDRIDIVLKHD